MPKEHELRKEARRKQLKTNVPEQVFVDGMWCDVDVELTFRIWGELYYGYDVRQKIKDLKRKAVLRTKRTGIPHHLDHIQPLAKGGLHKPFNLRIISAEDNLQKGDVFSPDDQAELARRVLGL